MSREMEVESEAVQRWGDVSLFEAREEGSGRGLGRVVRVKNGKREEDVVELRQMVPAEGGLSRVLGALVGQRADLTEEMHLALGDNGNGHDKNGAKNEQATVARYKWEHELAAYDLAISELSEMLYAEADGRAISGVGQGQLDMGLTGAEEPEVSEEEAMRLADESFREAWSEMHPGGEPAPTNRRSIKAGDRRKT